jgi:hypothetical protein
MVVEALVAAVVATPTMDTTGIATIKTAATATAILLLREPTHLRHRRRRLPLLCQRQTTPPSTPSTTAPILMQHMAATKLMSRCISSGWLPKVGKQPLPAHPVLRHLLRPLLRVRLHHLRHPLLSPRRLPPAGLRERADTVRYVRARTHLYCSCLTALRSLRHPDSDDYFRFAGGSLPNSNYLGQQGKRELASH